MERLFSVLLHKSVENDMGQTSLFLERSGPAVCLIFINQITLLGKCMLNGYKSTPQNRAVPKVTIMVISRLFKLLIFM